MWYNNVGREKMKKLKLYNELDILVSWNFKHLVKHKTRVEVTGVNTLLGYKNIDICAPWEVIESV